jgi:hypothetical protein
MGVNDKFFKRLVEKGILEVSRSGKVKNNRTGNEIGHYSDDGYVLINYMHPKTKKVRKLGVHRLVYLVYKSEIPKGYEINHRNGVKDDNRIKNLEAVKPKQNMEHAASNGLTARLLGSSNHTAKLTDKEVLSIRKLAKTMTYKRIANIFGVSNSNSIS